MAQQALKTGLSTNKIWVYSFLRSVLVPDQWWSTNFYYSNWNMRKPIYNRWWWLFTAMHSEAWAEGKASPGRSMRHVLWVCHFQEAELWAGALHWVCTSAGDTHWVSTWPADLLKAFWLGLLLQLLLLQTRNPWRSLKCSNSWGGRGNRRHNWRIWR